MMGKYILILLLIVSFLKNSYGGEIDNVAINSVKKQEDHIEFKYGVAIQNGKALYIDPDKIRKEIVAIFISEASIKNSKTDIIKNSVICFIEGGQIYIYDSKRETPYWKIFESKRVYYCKVVNNQLLIRKDKNIWEKLTVRIVNINDGKTIGYEEVPVYMTIYLECGYFKGEYELCGTPHT